MASRYPAARGRHLGERLVDVPRLDVYPAHPLAVDLDVEALAQRVERGVLHAVVRGEPDERDPVDPTLAQQRREAGAVEGGVAVGPGVLALVEHHVDAVTRQRRV